jgi:excisionase family DNA binding protein
MKYIRPEITGASGATGKSSNHIERVGLTVDEAAAAAGVSRSKIFEWLREKKLTAFHAGKQNIITPDELKRCIRALPHRGRKPDDTGAAA